MRKDESLFGTFKLVCNTIVHMFIAVVFLFNVNFAVTIYANYETIKLHVVFKSLGYLLLMMEAILTFQGDNSWSSLLSRQHKRIVHLCMQVLACGFIIAGLVMIILFREDLDQQHFVSPHGIIGLIAFIFSMISMVNGLGALQMAKSSNRTRSTGVKLVHTFTGTMAIVLGLIAMIVIMNEDQYIAYTNKIAYTVVGSVFLATCAFYIMIRPLLNMVSYVNSLKGTTV